MQMNTNLMAQDWTPMISIIIAVYNEEKRIDKCIQSVLQQVYQDFEIVIVDDGSTDDSVKMINNYIEEYRGKIVGIHKKNGGLASARNCGINVARGKYITFLDADDYIDQNYLLTLISIAEKYKCDMVCSGQYKVRENGTIIDHIIYKSNHGHCLTRRLNISGKMYLSSYINRENIRFPEGKTYEDNSFNLQAFFLSNRVYFLEYAGYYQVVHEGSITSKPIHKDNLPLSEWNYCIEKILTSKKENMDLQLFEFTVLSFFTYLLFVRIRKREYLSNADRKSNIDNAVVIAQVFQQITNKFFPYTRKNKYTRFFRYNTLPRSQKLGVKVFSWMCHWNKLDCFTKIFYKTVK